MKFSFVITCTNCDSKWGLSDVPREYECFCGEYFKVVPVSVTGDGVNKLSTTVVSGNNKQDSKDE